jgi:hypothetical protein
LVQLLRGSSAATSFGLPSLQPANVANRRSVGRDDIQCLWGEIDAIYYTNNGVDPSLTPVG